MCIIVKIFNTFFSHAIHFLHNILFSQFLVQFFFFFAVVLRRSRKKQQQFANFSVHDHWNSQNIYFAKKKIQFWFLTFEVIKILLNKSERAQKKIKKLTSGIFANQTRSYWKKGILQYFQYRCETLTLLVFFFLLFLHKLWHIRALANSIHCLNELNIKLHLSSIFLIQNAEKKNKKNNIHAISVTRAMFSEQCFESELVSWSLKEKKSHRPSAW